VCYRANGRLSTCAVVGGCLHFLHHNYQLSTSLVCSRERRTDFGHASPKRTGRLAILLEQRWSIIPVLVIRPLKALSTKSGRFEMTTPRLFTPSRAIVGRSEHFVRVMVPRRSQTHLNAFRRTDATGRLPFRYSCDCDSRGPLFFASRSVRAKGTLRPPMHHRRGCSRVQLTRRATLIDHPRRFCAVGKLDEIPQFI